MRKVQRAKRKCKQNNEDRRLRGPSAYVRTFDVGNLHKFYSGLLLILLLLSLMMMFFEMS